MNPAITAVRPGWLRRPTHADLLFLAILVWCFAAGEGGWMRLLMDGDAGVHLRIGDWVLENGRVPTHDLFGFSKPHGEWLAYEWLAGVIFSIAHSLAGLKGMVLLCGLVLAAVPAVIAMHAAWRGAQGWVVLLLTLVATNALNIHFLARPHIFTLLLLGLVSWIVEADRREHSSRLWLILPVVALWANLHGGFFILFPYFAVLTLESRRYAWLGAGAAVAALANPYGWKLHAHVIEYLRSDWVIRFVDEFKSPSFRAEPMLCFMLLLFAALGCAGLWLTRKRYVDVLLVLMFSYLALTSVRHTTIFMVVIIPLVAEEISRWLKAPLPEFDFRVMTPWTAAFALFIAVVPGMAWPTQFPEDLFPVKLVDKHAARLEQARVFTSDQWADYLIYRNYSPGVDGPRQQVFMDARHNYFGPKIGNEFIHLMNGLPDWKQIINRYRFDAMLLPPDTPLSALLAERPEWQVLDRDPRAVLWVKTAADRSPSASLAPAGSRR